jgi:TolB-like protein/DNA-binding winged helix-turn-helix (wHTH) protein/Flp pilus assembly protein TadD
MEPQPRRVFRFGPFQLEPAARRLQRNGEPVNLKSKAFDTLLILVERHGHPVSKDELMQRLWPGVVVEENNLSQNISALRKALGTDHRYIATLPGEGFQFVADVEERADGREAFAVTRPPGADQGESRGLPVPEGRPGRAHGKRRPRAITYGVVIAAALALALALLRPRTQTEADSAPSRATMLAVLPFENLSADPDEDYFSDGLTEEMITQLASLNPDRLGVIARTSAMLYKRTNKGAAQIGRELGADYILEGSVRRSGERVRITAQLILARTQAHVWADSYERRVDDILMLQSEVARAIAREISVQLSAHQESRLASSRTVVPRAYEAHLKGRYFWNQRTTDGFQKALLHFQEALRLDAEYAGAYAGMADTYTLLGYYSILPPHEAYPKAKAAALKALDIDPTLAEAHSSLAGVYMDYEWTWDAVEQEYIRALQLNPGYAVAHQWFGNYLSAMGRSQEAIRETLRARELDPLSKIVNANVGWVYHLARQDDKAVEEAQKALELDANFYWTHLLLGRARLQQNMREEAIASFEKASTLSGGNPMVLGELGHAYAVTGRRADADKVLAQLSRREYPPPYEIALIHAGMGDIDQSLAWLDKSYRERARALGFAKVEPRLDPLRADPRFVALLRRLALP